MATLYDPASKGFDPRLSLIDRAQVALLRELASSLGGRLVLKGGMAMRATVGSMRLTKDMDFDRAASLSAASLKGQLKAGLRAAAANAGIRAVDVQITKDTATRRRASRPSRSWRSWGTNWPVKNCFLISRWINGTR